MLHLRGKVLCFAILHVKVRLQYENGLVVNVLVAVVLQLLDFVQALRLINQLRAEYTEVNQMGQPSAPATTEGMRLHGTKAMNRRQ